MLLLACGHASAMECWKATPGDRGNVSLLCLDGWDRAEHRFYFSNKGTASPPTTCIEKGEVTRSGERFEVRLAAGTCENRKTTSGTHLYCERRGERMTCILAMPDGTKNQFSYQQVFP